MQFKLLFVFIITFLTGCGGGGGGQGGNFDSILSNGDAEDVINTITTAVDAVDSDISGSTFLNVTSPGQTGGSATVNGYKTYSQTSCGTDCISDTNYTEITIEFSNYIILDGIEISSGTVYYTETRTSRQSGLSYSSTTSISLSSYRPVVVSAVSYWYSGVPNGVKGTVDFSGTSSSTLMFLSGSLTTNLGGSFSF